MVNFLNQFNTLGTTIAINGPATIVTGGAGNPLISAPGLGGLGGGLYGGAQPGILPYGGGAQPGILPYGGGAQGLLSQISSKWSEISNTFNNVNSLFGNLLGGGLGS